MYYIYQTLLDTGNALQAASGEGQQAQQAALDHQQVQALCNALVHAAAFEMSVIFVDVLREVCTANLLDEVSHHQM